MSHSSVLGSYPVLTFVATADHARASRFYRDVLGLRLVAEELPFAVVFDAGGTMLRISIVKELTPAPYTVLGWRVPDIAAAVSQLAGAGIAFERFPWMKDQDERGIWRSPSGACVAWFKDPDGNTLSLTQFPGD